MNGVSIAQLAYLALHRRVAVPAELAGCIILAAADQLLDSPRELAPADLLLFDDGLVRLSGGQESEALNAEARLRELLGTLLASASSVTPALRRAAQRSPLGDVQAFVRELEIALVPTNRSASKRALARLCREARRGVESDADPVDEILDGQRRLAAAVVPSQAQTIPAPEHHCAAPQPSNIPDLEVPTQSISDRAPVSRGAGISGVTASNSDGEPELLELSEADVIDVTESTEWPQVRLEEPVVAFAENNLEVSDAVVVEATLPLPLIRVIRPAEPLASSNEPSSARQGNAPPLRFARMKRPLFSATQVIPESPDMPTEAVVSPGLNSTQLVGERTDSAVIGSGTEQRNTRPSTQRCPTIAPDLGAKQPVAGPHRFIARARFSKKDTNVTERVLQFGDATHAESDQLVDGLHRLAGEGNRG